MDDLGAAAVVGGVAGSAPTILKHAVDFIKALRKSEAEKQQLSAEAKVEALETANKNEVLEQIADLKAALADTTTTILAKLTSIEVASARHEERHEALARRVDTLETDVKSIRRVRK